MSQKKIQRFLASYGFLKGNVGVLIVCRTIWNFSRFGVASFFSLYILALGGSPAIMGLFSMLGSISQFITRPLGGYLADHADRRIVISIFTVVLALAYLSYVFANSVTELLIGTLIINLCFIQSPSLQSLTADSLSNEQMAIGYSTQLAAQRITPFILAFVGGILIETIGLTSGVRLGYSGAVLGGLLVAYIRYRFLKEMRKNPMKMVPLREIPSIFLKAYQEIFSMLMNLSKNLKILILMAVLVSVATLLTGPFSIVYANEIIGLTPTELGLIIMVSGICSVVTSLFAGHLVNKFGRKRTMVVSLFLVSPVTLSFVYCQTFQHVLVYWSLTTILIAFLTPAFQALFMGIVPIEQRGRAIAAVGTNPFTFLRSNTGMMAGLGFLAYIPAIGLPRLAAIFMNSTHCIRGSSSLVS